MLQRNTNQSIEEFAESLRQLDVQVRQLSPGVFRGVTDTLVLDAARLVRRKASVRYSSSGWFKNSVMFLFHASDVVVNGAHLDRTRQVAASGNFEVCNVFPAQVELLLVEIRLDHLSRHLGAEDLELFLGRIKSPGALMCDATLKSRVGKALLDLFDHVSRLPAGLAESMKAEYCRQVVWMLFDYLDSLQAGVGRQHVARERVLFRALRYLHDNPDCSFDELARASFASRRTLQYLFANNLQDSPARFAKRLRLSLVYQELALGKPPASLQELAFRHGFTNQSRLGREYRAMFGEAPMDTLHRALGAGKAS